MIRVGVAGWDYPDWKGVVYPAGAGRTFDRLAFLSRYFDLIEINVSFYRQLDPAMARSWASRVSTSGSFRFTAKLHRTLTHAGGAADEAEEHVPAASLDLASEAARYREGVAPLVESGLLGAVLMQFPQSFHDTAPNREHLARLADLLAGLPLVAEFRHRGWDDAGVMAWLRDLGIGFCNIDQPSLGSTLPPTCHLTSRIAYIRLHGRNAADWFRKGAPPASRYDYLYSEEELLPWSERARRLDARAEEVFIVANNHYRGKGPTNALMLAAALKGGRVKSPADLAAAYPALAEVSEVEAPKRPRQRRLL